MTVTAPTTAMIQWLEDDRLQLLVSYCSYNGRSRSMILPLLLLLGAHAACRLLITPKYSLFGRYAIIKIPIL